MRLNQVTVATTDVDRAVEFYGLLGLKLIVWSPDYARFVGPDRQSSLSVHRHEELIASSTTIYFECDDVDSEVARLVAVGMRFSLMPTDQPWLWREARLADPDGNPLCIYHAGRYRLDPPWRVVSPTDGSDIL